LKLTNKKQYLYSAKEKRSSKKPTPGTFQAVCDNCDFIGPEEPTEDAAAGDGLEHVGEAGNSDHIVNVIKN
jgi:hypothetical protein